MRSNLLAVLAQKMEPVLEVLSEHYQKTAGYQEFTIAVRDESVLLKAEPCGKSRVLVTSRPLKTDLDAYNWMKEEVKRFVQETYDEIVPTTP